MKQVGIITHYYNSHNYGGLLQAYALCRVLSANGISCEQISFDMAKDYIRLNPPASVKHSLSSRVRSWRLRVTRKLQKMYVLRRLPLERLQRERAEACVAFRDSIPHSREVYTSATISACADRYAAFITGSDQVWNTDSYCSAFFLDFVPSDKVKLSYAASLGHDTLSETDRAMLQKSLADYTAVSVREGESVALVQDFSPVPVRLCLDPTLLLSREDWDEICPPRRIEEPYVLCYFLGAGRHMRRAAKDYAARHGLKLVTFPYLTGTFHVDPLVDHGFGDHPLYDVSPDAFVSLIKHADCVFTDSFHATVFSILYQKPFFVYERYLSRGMSTRILSLTRLFDATHRICTPKTRPDELAPVEYETHRQALEDLRRESIAFLLHNLT